MSDESRARIVDTQNMARKGDKSVSRQRMMNNSDMRLPGEGLSKEAPGEVKEGSFRSCAWNMDKITGPDRDNADLDVVSDPK